MELKETGNFRWDADGFSSFDDAKEAVKEIMKNLPDFLFKSSIKSNVSQDLSTMIISAHISSSVYGDDPYDI